MYLTAQLVRSRAGAEGVNAYLSVHGADALPFAAGEALDLERIARSSAGLEVARSESVRPGGNAVRAYLDLAADDVVPEDAIVAALKELADRIRANGLPGYVSQNGIAARAGGVEELARDPGAAHAVYAGLCAAALGLLPRRGEERPSPAGPLVVHAGYSFGGVRLWLPPVTLARLPSAPMRRLRLLVPEELLKPPHTPGEVLREAAQLLIGGTSAELCEAGGLEILDPRTGTVFVAAVEAQ